MSPIVARAIRRAEAELALVSSDPQRSLDKARELVAEAKRLQRLFLEAQADPTGPAWDRWREATKEIL